MATYEYQCMQCDDSKIEVERSMSEDEPSGGYVCGKCGYKLIRVWNAAPITFKGKGFYSTGN
jgi:putative FmdB family regulatory protein